MQGAGVGVERFEDLVAWQKSRELAKANYLATRSDRFAKDFGLSGQIQRAAVSVMSNIAEGFERTNPSEFHHFLVVAKASCAEVRSQLYIALDIGYLNQPEFTQLLQQSQEVGKIVSGLAISVERRRKDQ
jgi:four helix bundle protein